MSIVRRLRWMIDDDCVGLLGVDGLSDGVSDDHLDRDARIN